MNSVALIGRLTKDPVQKVTANDKTVCTFTLAVDRRFGEGSDFIPIVAWGKLAEICGSYLAKGKQVGITGEMRTRTYDDQHGQRRYVTEVNAETMKMLDKKEERGSAAPRGYEDEQDNFEELAAGELPF